MASEVTTPEAFDAWLADGVNRRPRLYGADASKGPRIDSVGPKPLDVERAEKVTPEAGKPVSVPNPPPVAAPPKVDWKSSAAGESDDEWDGIYEEPIREDSNEDGI